MEDLMKIRRMYALKHVNRDALVGERKESSAEHTWSCMILADYLITRFKLKIDRLKVYELLLFHDVVEIECGDTPINDEEKRKNKAEYEADAINKLKHQIPSVMKERLIGLFKEFNDGDSIEAKFARAIDGFDAIIHELDYPKAWKGWSEGMIRKYYDKRFSEIPEMKNLFEKMIVFLHKNKYIE